MNKIKGLFIVVMMAIIAIPASAQFRIGPRLGFNVNELHFNQSVLDSDNRAGFTGGLMAEFTVPLVGLGFDASFMYVRRDARWLEGNEYTSDKRDYFEIPINLKWKIGVPVIGKIITPYLATGPSFAFLTSGKNVRDGIKNKSFDAAWNFGFGVELLSHLQIGASYGLGMTKALEAVGGANGVDIEGKNRYWTVTAAYLF